MKYAFKFYVHLISDVADDRIGSWTVRRECAKITDVQEKLKKNVGSDGWGCTTAYKYDDTFDEDSTVCYCHTNLCNNSKSINSQKISTWFCALILLSVISQTAVL